MSSTTVTMHNNTIFTNTRTKTSILVGNISIATPAPDAIVFPAVAPSDQTANIILQKGTDNVLKTEMLNAPVHPNCINLYDQSGCLINRYKPDRITNETGALRITSEDKTLFCNIELPKCSSEEQNYLVISSYSGMNECAMPNRKRALIRRDIGEFNKIHKLSDLIVFINESIYTEIIGSGIKEELDFDNIFKELHIVKQLSLIKYVVEYLVGNSVAGSKPNFQGMLNFGPKTEVSVCRFNNLQLTHQIRSGGRVQLNTNGKITNSTYLIIVTHSEELNSITEDVTSSSFACVPFTSDMLCEITSAQLTTIIDAFTFVSNMVKQTTFEKMKEFILTNQTDCITYMFNTPLDALMTIDSDSCLINTIIDSVYQLHHQITTGLQTHYYSNISSSAKKVNRRLSKEGEFGFQHAFGAPPPPLKYGGKNITVHSGVGATGATP